MRNIARLPTGTIMRAAAIAILSLSVAAMVSRPAPASASDGFRVLHSVCAHEDCNAGGAGTTAGLLRDTAGNLYGTTVRGGANGAGEVFRLSPHADRKGWDYARLYSFCPKVGCESGAVVWGPLIIDLSGNLYGVTTAGGKGGFGNAFELSPDAARARWSYKVLYDFCRQGGQPCREAFGFNFGLTYAGAASGAPYDGQSPLYGTSAYGGYGFGNVFSLNPRAGKNRWAFHQVYAFCASYPQCADGALPWMGHATADAAGNLYGTATAGGANGGGVVYELTQANKNNWTETVLHNFCSLADCADGSAPSGSLLLDATGNLYGATAAGPSNCADAANCGVIFRLSPGSPWQETVLHTFCQLPNCTDGAGAGGGFAMDAAGNLVGATFIGGTQNAGTVFRLGDAFTVLHNFCNDPNCADGQYPQSAIALDASGHIFGLTQNGGAQNAGALFELKR